MLNMDILNEKKKKRLFREVDLACIEEDSENNNESIINNIHNNYNENVNNFNINENTNQGNDVFLFKDADSVKNNSNDTILNSSGKYDQKCTSDIYYEDSVIFTKLNKSCINDLSITENNFYKISNESVALKKNGDRISVSGSNGKGNENTNNDYENNYDEVKNVKKDISDEENTNNGNCNKNTNDNLIEISNKKETIKKTNEYIDNCDLSFINEYENEIDNRTKRKMSSSIQNEEIKKMKKGINDISSPIINNTLNLDIYPIEKCNNSSVCEKKNEEANEKAADDTQDDAITFTEEVLKKYPRIFATRLPFEADKIDLENHFSKYGKIVDIYVSKNISNNKNKGFGFVSFETQESMNKALEDKLHIICGKEIVVDVASMRDNKSGYSYHLPSNHYLMKNQKNYLSKVPINNINFNRHHIYNKYNNIGIKTISNDHNLVSHMDNLNHDYSMIVNRISADNAYKKKQLPVSSQSSFNNITEHNMSSFKFKKTKKICIPPIEYTMNPKYYNSFNYKNFAPYIENGYYCSSLNSQHLNNMVPHNENAYTSKSVPYLHYVFNSQHLDQNLITNNNILQKNHIIVQNTSKYPLNYTNTNFGPTYSPYVRKLPGGDEWNKRGYKLFVTKLNSVTTIDTLRSYFEKFGEIIDIYMPNDIYTNRPRGIAFVTFLDSECVKNILSEKNIKHIIDGKEVVIDLADPDTKSKKKF